MTPIEQIKPGDQVWSYDQQHEQWVLEDVLDAQQRDYDGDMITLHLDLGDGSSDEITCTGNHPFWVVSGDRLDERPSVSDLPAADQVAKPSGRWTEARWLRLGDRFKRTGYSATVSGLMIRMERVKVYNLKVKQLQLYAIGLRGVLVHNSLSPYRFTQPGEVYYHYGYADQTPGFGNGLSPAVSQHPIRL